ncbi:MAG: hypothetical protein ACTSVY_07085, partial [Candidatus Helarchaeota archaeon]
RIKIGRKLTDDFRISIKDLVKSSFDSPERRNEILNNLKNHYLEYKDIVTKIRENTNKILKVLNENIEKYNKL